MKNNPKKGEYKKTLGHLQMYQHSNHRGARREQKEQEIENLFEKIVKGNFPNLVKEIDTQVQEAKSQTSWTQKGPHQDTSLLKCQRLKIESES